jgi:hypothetical protein
LKCWNLPALSKANIFLFSSMISSCFVVSKCLRQHVEHVFSYTHTHTHIYIYICTPINRYTHSHTLLFILCVTCLEQNHGYYHALQYVVYLCKSSTGAHGWQLFFIGGIECNSTINTAR